MRIKPAPGVKVRDPDSKQHVPEAGKEVQPTSFWLRRLADGDVVLVEADQIPDSKRKAVKP